MEPVENVFELAHAIPQGVLGDQVSSFLHETPDDTRRAFESALPVSVAGIAQRASTTEGAQELLNAFKQGSYPHIEVEDLSRTVSDPVAADQLVKSGEGFMSRIFGGKLGGVLDGLAAQTGVSRSSAERLLGLVTPLVLGVIGKGAVSKNMDAGGLSRSLGDLGRRAASMLPGPLGRMFGAQPSVVDRPRRDEPPMVREPAARRPAHVEPAHRGLWWLFAGLAILGALALLLGRGGPREIRRHPAGQPPLPTVSEPRPPMGATPPAPVMPTPKVESLIGGTGVPALSSFLASDTVPPRRFVVEGLEYSTGSADIDRSTSRVLDEIAGVLAARPTVKIRLEGHTDTTGDVDANRRLSQERAESVKSYLVARGVAADRIEAVGYGADRPMAPNDSDEGRARNRRTELVIVSR